MEARMYLPQGQWGSGPCAFDCHGWSKSPRRSNSSLNVGTHNNNNNNKFLPLPSATSKRNVVNFQLRPPFRLTDSCLDPSRVTVGGREVLQPGRSWKLNTDQIESLHPVVPNFRARSWEADITGVNKL